MQSDANMHLVGDQQLNVIGSKIAAGGLLDVAAKRVNVSGAANRQESSQSSYQFGFSKKFEKEKEKMNIEGLVNEVINTWLDGREIKNPIKLFLNHRTYQRAVTLGVQQETEKVRETNHNAAQIVGGDVVVNAQAVTLAGSHINATGGNVSMNAQQINALAQYNTKKTEKNAQTIGLTAGLSSTPKGTNAYLTLGGQHIQSDEQKQTAQGSRVEAVQNVQLNAKQITHQGSVLSTQQGDIIENAQTVKHDTAKTTHFTNTKHIKAGITALVNVDKNFNHTYGLEIAAEGGRESSMEKQHTATQLNSGRNVVVSADKVRDVGTQYQANNEILLVSQQHVIESALDSKQGNKMTAGAKVGVGIEGKSENNKAGAIKVNLAANYQENQNASTSAVQANVNGKNVHILTGHFNGQGNIKAEDSVYLNSEGQLNFTQTTENSQKSGGGFNALLEVGGIVVGNTVLPSVDVSLSANGEKGNAQTAVMNHIRGKQVVLVSDGNNDMQGTNITAEDAQISGQRVRLESATSNAKLNAGSAAISVGIGKGASSAKASAKFSVNFANLSEYKTYYK